MKNPLPNYPAYEAPTTAPSRETTNLEIYVQAIRAMKLPNRGDAEREFVERYQPTVATTGLAMAEALAKAEVRYLLNHVEIAPEGAEYLISHLT